MNGNFGPDLPPSSPKKTVEVLGPRQWSETKFPWDERVSLANENVFNNSSFREPQRAAINSVLSKKDTLVLLPTGGGKSLIYQIPAVVTEGLAIVVMPLISLMIDQCIGLKSKGIRAEVLTGACTVAQTREVYDLMRANAVDVVFITPEKFGASGAFKNLLNDIQDHITLFVIDEAHCISQWGSDFRPDYRKLSILRTAYGSVPILALTASATVKSIDDICGQLQMRDPQIFRKSFDRSNIKYIVKQRCADDSHRSPIATMLTKLRQNQTGIIYCLTRNECTVLADKLKGMGLKCGCYHAGLSANERERAQTDWMNNEFRIMIATIAFGLGIDKPDVRFIIHLTLPKSIENFFQESGRAGRDGLPSESYLFWDYSDKARLQRLQSGNTSGTKAVNFMLDYCSNTSACRRTLLLDYFGEKFDPKNCILQCDNCERKASVCTRNIDCSREARLILDFVTAINVRSGSKWSPGLTLADLRNLLLGKKIKKQEYFDRALKETKLFGALRSSWTIAKTQLLLQKLLSTKILSEKTVKLPHRGVTTYLYPGLKSSAVQSFTMEMGGLARAQDSVDVEDIGQFEEPAFVADRLSIEDQENDQKSLNDVFESSRLRRLPASICQEQRESDAGYPDPELSPAALSDNVVIWNGEQLRRSTATEISAFSEDYVNHMRLSINSENNTAAFAEEFTPIRKALTSSQQEDLLTDLIIERRALKHKFAVSDLKDIMTIENIQTITSNCPDNIFKLSALEILSEEQVSKYGFDVINVVKKFLDNL